MEHIDVEQGEKKAEKEVDKVFRVFNDCIGKEHPRVELSEIVMGKRLGSGKFCVIHEVSRFQPGEVDFGDLDEADLTLQLENRKFISDHCICQKQEEKVGGDARSAIKVLLPEVISDPKKYNMGMKALMAEALFLSRIEHPNIIKMRAFPTVGTFENNFFLVLDRLYDTLEDRIAKWRKQSMKMKLSGPLSMMKSKKSNKNSLEEERLVIAYDIMAAINYLHDKKIVHRDLKAENFGFDARGDIKIFDFGFAKQLKQQDIVDVKHNLYNLTGLIGTMVYMAPEVYKGQPYNESVDVYSFAICLWEMYSLSQAYYGYNESMVENLIIAKGDRPKVKDNWPVPIKLLLNRAWSADMKERPTAQSILTFLEKVLTAMQSGNKTGFEPNRRKSTPVLRKSPALAA